MRRRRRRCHRRVHRIRTNSLFVHSYLCARCRRSRRSRLRVRPKGSAPLIHVRHHENIRPSLSLFLLRPCGHRGLKQYRALRAGKSCECTQHVASKLFLSAARTTVWWEREVKAAPFRRDFACRAKCAAIDIIKRERATATREKETGDSLFLLTILLCAGCIRESAIRIRLPLLKCLAQIPTPCCASVATRLRVGK